MFCKLCQKRGNAPSTARGAWTTQGIQDWNHATEQLKEHSQSKCPRDAVIHARMTEQGKEQSVLELQCSAAAKEAEERRAKNRNIVLKLLRSIYFLPKIACPYQPHSIPRSICKLQMEMNFSNNMSKRGHKMLSTHPNFLQ